MITIKSKGNFNKTTKFLGFIWRKEFLKKLDKYGQMGVEALQKATPIDSGVTSDSWSYKIQTSSKGVKLHWVNSNTTKDGTPIVILLQYGHSVNGGYVYGKDFINPAIEPIFNYIADDVWKEVVNAWVQ